MGIVYCGMETGVYYVHRRKSRTRVENGNSFIHIRSCGHAFSIYPNPGKIRKCSVSILMQFHKSVSCSNNLMNAVAWIWMRKLFKFYPFILLLGKKTQTFFIEVDSLAGQSKLGQLAYH